MRNRSILAALVTLLTVVSLLAVFPTAVPAKAAADQPNVLYLAMQQDIPDFNTWNLASNSVWKSNVINWGFEALVGLDYDLLPFGVLATDWTFDEPTLTWTFNLRQGVTFHDGTQFTADDVVFIYTHVGGGLSYSSNLVNAFDANGDGECSPAELTDAVTKVDTYTVKMKMAVPYGQFLIDTAGLPIMPKAIWENNLDEDGVWLNALWNDPDATISTGPWMYKEGEQNVYRIMEKYDGYWGKNATTPLGYHMWAPNIDQLYYKIYASIDTAILAIQSGAVDHICWAVTAGRVPSLQADPSIELTYLADNGYFYFAFNMKFDPMGDLNFRKAVSHVIDKDQIVNVYMGGYGTKGSASEPPFWGEWFNSSVNKYPYSVEAGNTLLNTSGYMDVNDDGWREMPDGTPMQKITILTPPADYDPVRIRAGQMIAKNMRDGLHINAEAKAIDFDTLVTKLNSMDYQLLIIGWSLSTNPVGNVFDILGPKASQNTFGFWNVSDPNPFYKDLYGVSTRADAKTQDMANEITRLGELAKQSFDVADQLLYTKWAEGVLADALPCNVLYYRVQILATKNTWTGWLPYQGDLFGPGANLFSLSNLQKTGAGGGGAAGATATVNAGLSLPGKVAMGKSVDAWVTAIDNLGAPVSAATVAVSVEGVSGADTVTASATSGTTSAAGIFGFSLSGDELGYSYVNVTVTKGGVSSAQSGTITCVQAIPNTLALKVTASKLVLGPGETSTVTLNVTDQNGAAVQGATVAIDPNLVGYGQVDAVTKTTDKWGGATMIYTAPAAINELNSHLMVTLSYVAAKAGYGTWPGAAAANLLLFNDAAPDWIMYQVTGLTDRLINAAGNTTTITVHVTDDEGNALASHPVNITYSNESALFNPVMAATTNPSGDAQFVVQFKAGIPSMGLRVTMTDASVLNSLPATITLTYAGANPVPKMYGGYMTWDLPAPYLSPATDAVITATAHIWDETGADVNGMNASLIVGGTSYGLLTWCDAINWSSTFDGYGINVITTNDGANLVASGPFNTYFDKANWNTWYNDMGYIYWNWTTDWLDGNPMVMTGVQITAGTLDIVIDRTIIENQYTAEGQLDVAPLDLIGSIMVVPGGKGWYNSNSNSYQIDGSTTISSQYVIGRSYEVVAPNVAIAKPVMLQRVGGVDATTATVTAMDQTNTKVAGITTSVYQNGISGNSVYKVIPYLSAGSQWMSGVVMTASNGKAVSTIEAIGKNNVVATASARADLYAKASRDGAISLFAQNQIIIHLTEVFATFDAIADVQWIGPKLAVGVSVANAAGGAVAGVPVELTVSTGASVEQPMLSSDSTGRVLFVVDTSGMTNARAAFLSLQVKAAGAGFAVGMGTMTVAMKNAGPSVVGLSPADSEEVVGTNVTMGGSVSDINGVQSVRYKLDDGSFLTLSGTPGATVWDLTKNLGVLDTGEHTLTVNATDALGISTQTSVTFTVSSAEAGTDWVAWGVAIVGWVIAALVLVMMMMRKPKSAAPEPAKPEEEQKM